eukprot:6443579-Amphidinium_carterae.2
MQGAARTTTATTTTTRETTTTTTASRRTMVGMQARDHGAYIAGCCDLKRATVLYEKGVQVVKSSQEEAGFVFGRFARVLTCCKVLSCNRAGWLRLASQAWNLKSGSFIAELLRW